ADPELEAIRQRRMQELMAQNGVGNSQNSDKQKAQEEAKRNLTTQCREDELVEEVNGDDDVAPVARIALVKPEKARGVEDVILRAAQMGQIVEKVSEERLISLLEQINTQTTKQTKVTVRPNLLFISLTSLAYCLHDLYLMLPLLSCAAVISQIQRRRSVLEDDD
ncbi:hypothetical protein C3L33_16249, partial [Rhododendron williamsianum]